MPALDRRITVRRTMQTVNQFGESTVTETGYTAWATRVDRSQMDKAEEGGEATILRRDYIVRYRSEIAAALVAELSVITDDGQTLSVDNVIEQARERSERRRFIRLECVGEA